VAAALSSAAGKRSPMADLIDVTGRAGESGSSWPISCGSDRIVQEWFFYILAQMRV